MTRTPRVTTHGPGITPSDIDYDVVLVPLDGSPEAERALAPAAGLARMFGASIHVIAGAVSRDKRWWYEKYLAGVRGTDQPVVTHVSDDPDAAAAIVSSARRLDPSLVCMATHGRARSAAVVGSTFASVVARLHAPLVAIGPRVRAIDRRAVGHLALCLDGDAGVDPAVALAAGLARRLGWRVTLLTAADPVIAPTEREEGAPDAHLRAVALRDEFAGLPVDTRVLWGIGPPHLTIGEHLDAEPIDLLVAPTHARTGLSRVVLGSEVASIVHRSPVPVLVLTAR